MQAPQPVLIASGFGDEVSGGGMFAVNGSQAERIDTVSSMGLAYDGRRLARILRCGGQDQHVAEVAVYDEGGVLRYMRLDAAAGGHDAAWDGENVVVVSTYDNAVRWFSPACELVHEVLFAGPRDSWHINCITRRDGVWYATMFGPVGPFRGSSTAREGLGRIIELTSGKTVVAGLTAPHTPRWLDGMWVVCNSGKDELLAMDEASGRIVRRIACGQWTRGIAFDDEFLYVGTCRRRRTEESFGNAEIVVLDRATWTQVERIGVAAQELYDLAFIPPPLFEGVRRGFDVNPLRTREQRQHRIMGELGVEQPRSLWPTGDPLPWSDFRCTLECTLPETISAEGLVEFPVRVTNSSRSFFTSAAPAPVYLSYKWLDPVTGAYLNDLRAYRSKLPRTIFPGESLEVTAFVVVPGTPGRAIFRLTLMQEGVTWFDDQDPSNALEFEVEIAPAEPAEWKTTAPAVR